ncbi:DNA-directed RNA polymerase [Candidatus Parvarchaeota archaeon]|nr:DNA-directed RNA polymerase [Candidatus Parvarchaeota archaeon]
MYQVVNISDRVRIPPEVFGMKLTDAVAQIVRDRYERRMDHEIGMVLAIWNAKAHGDGVVIPGDGAAHFDVTFDALVFKPQINQIIEAEVSELVEFGAFLGLGPLEGLVHLSQIANDYLTYNKKIPAFVGKESKKSLKKGDIVAAKISTVSIKGASTDSKIGLTMRPEGLGKIEWIDVQARKKAAGKDEPAKEAKEKKEKVDKRQKRGE